MTERGDTVTRTGRDGTTGSTGRTTSRASGGGLQRAAAFVASVGAAATALLAIGHAGVDVPLVSVLGPGGSRAVWPAAVAFTVAAAAYVVVAVALTRGRSWAAPAAGAVFAVTLVGSLLPFRGPASLLGALLGAVGLGLAGAAVTRGRRSPTPRDPTA